MALKTGVASLILGVVLSGVMMGGETGKIVGTVKERGTGQPLPGANITIEGTVLGGSTDPEGRATILLVPPGVYVVKATLIGYAPIAVQDVRVQIDQTTTLELEMWEESISLGEVVVTVPRSPVKRDVSTSVSSVEEKEIAVLPVTSVEDVANLNAGVEDGFVIRGGDADESLFKLDGVTLRDPRTNQPITGVALSAVKEISVERGGFRAEYGDVRSGIVNVVTKEGSKTGYTADLTVRYTPAEYKYSGISPYDPNSMWLRPYLDPAVAWTGTANGAWDEFTQNQYPTFEGWNVISDRLLSDDDPTNDLSPAAAQRLFLWQHRRTASLEPDYLIDAGLGGPFPFVNEALGNLRFFLSYRRNREMLMVPLTRDDFTEYDWSLKLTSDITSSAILMVTGTLGESQNIAVNGTEQNNSTDYIRTPYQIAEQISLQPFTSSSRVFSDSYYSGATVRQYSMAAKLTSILSSTTAYEAKIEYIGRDYNTEPTRARDTSKVYEIAPGFFVDEAPFGWSPNPDVGIGDGILMGGHTSTARDLSTISSTTLKFDLTSQLNPENEVKTGIEFAYYNLHLDYGIVNLVFPESNTYARWSRAPLRGAIYLQDKLETHGFIANLGVRVDYNNPNGEWFDVATFDKTFYTAQYDPDASYPMRDIKSEITVSPRLGISHPITTSSKLYFNYGHFKQMPAYEQIFRVSRGSGQQVKDIGDPGLDRARTISYELGYDHSLFDEYLLQLAAFYHDVTDEQDSIQYISADATVNYFGASSTGYSDRRGFEITFRKSPVGWWGGFINYTYLVTSSGQFGQAEIYEDPSAQRQYDRQTANLYQTRPVPQPFARANLVLHSPAEEGMLLGDWNLSLLADWRSGGFVYRNPNLVSYITTNTPNVAQPDYFNLNLRLSKSFAFGQTRLTFLMDMTNVLDTKRLSLVSFYDFDDQEAYYNSLHLPSSPAYNNIPGDDKAGDYRDPDVPFQPIVQEAIVTDIPTPNASVIYYETSSGRYMNYLNGAWSEVDAGRLQQVLDDKAYIDMPNQTSFSFLNPRRIFFGLTVSFNLE